MSDHDDAILFRDLCRHAHVEAARAVMRVGRLGPTNMASGIFMNAAQRLTIDAAATFLASCGRRDFDHTAGIDDPAICEVFVAVTRSWAMAPDRDGAEQALVDALTKFGHVKVG